MADFQVGDLVAWTSQSAGISKTKHGKVVEVVAAFQVPKMAPGDAGRARDHQSYVVRVDTGKGRLRTYWPRTSQISLQQPPFSEGVANG